MKIILKWPETLFSGQLDWDPQTWDNWLTVLPTVLPKLAQLSISYRDIINAKNACIFVHAVAALSLDRARCLVVKTKKWSPGQRLILESRLSRSLG